MIKKILTAVIVVLAIFLIYLGFKDDDVYYLSLGDSLAYGITPYGGKDYGYGEYVRDYLQDKEKLEAYVDGLVKPNKRAVDIIKEIKENVEVDVNGKKKHFQNVLIKSDIISLSIGMNDFIGDLKIDYTFSVNDLYDRFEEAYKDLDQLFKLLREYCKEEIVIIGYYDPTSNDNLKDYFDYVNKKVASLANSYNMSFVNTYNIFKEQKYFENPNSFYPNKDGYVKIGTEITNIIDEKVLKQ